MAVFSDLKTPIKVREYLCDVLERMENNHEKFLYHYTSFTSIYNIITSGYLWLGSVENMNDYQEGAYVKEVHGSYRVYAMCFSRDEENIAMYKMYAPNPDGAILAFPIKYAQQMIDDLPNSKEQNKLVHIVRNNILTKETTPAALHWTAIAYKNLHEDTLRLNNQRNEWIPDPIHTKELAGYIKFHGWEYEKEIRLMAYLFNERAENEKIAVKLPINIEKQIQIITCPDFDKTHHRKEIATLKYLGINMQESAYDATADLRESITNDSAKRIAELQEENDKLKSRIKELDNKEIKEYLDEYKELRKEALSQLSFYSSAYMNPMETMTKWHEEASRSLRNIAADFDGFCRIKQPKGIINPQKENLKLVSGCFFALSNGVRLYEGEEALRRIDDNEKSRNQIITLLEE